MNYYTIVNLIFSILTCLIGLTYCHFFLFAIVGLFKRKTYKKAKVQHTYGIVIAARNEEKVIGNLIESIRKTNYPQDKLHIFVVAHNCTDNTAQICKDLGATVYEYNNPDERTKGYALKYLFDAINKDFGTESLDGYFVFDADNILSKNYFEKMNDAFDAYDGKCIITSFRNSKNFGSNIISGLYGVYFTTGCLMEMKGRTVLNCSTRVSGTGYVINSKYLKNGWKYVTLTEDWEITADHIIDGNKIQYCDEAEYFDEQPTTFKVMWRQRVRWSRGHLLVCVTRLKELFRNLFAKKDKHALKVSTYDMIANIMPFGLILTGLTILQVALLLFSPLFVPSMTFGAVVLNWLKNFGMTCLVSYLMTFIGAIVVFVAERKRIQGVSFLKKVALCLIWPLFLAIQLPIDVVALFYKNCGWKVIPHNDTTDFEKLNKVAETASADVVEDDNTKSEL
ncbi:MAG: glycosyltransferase family 2 protein [Clostridia bacterium]|nr:glycosyltransferase family 2 protein [Clostridia bacterium]